MSELYPIVKAEGILDSVEIRRGMPYKGWGYPSDLVFIRIEGEVSPLKFFLSSGRVPKGSDDPATLPLGSKVQFEYKKIFNDLASIKAV